MACGLACRAGRGTGLEQLLAGGVGPVVVAAAPRATPWRTAAAPDISYFVEVLLVGRAGRSRPGGCFVRGRSARHRYHESTTAESGGPSARYGRRRALAPGPGGNLLAVARPARYVTSAGTGLVVRRAAGGLCRPSSRASLRRGNRRC